MINKAIKTDNEGFMLHPEEWNEDIALSIADDLGLEMGDDGIRRLHASACPLLADTGSCASTVRRHCRAA